MTEVFTKDFFLWGFFLNLGILLWWFGFYVFANDWLFNFHTKIFKISRESYDMIHYSGMAMYKIANFTFFLVPYIALCAKSS